MTLRQTALGRVLRRLGPTPLFTAISVLTLGVGIGANAAIFSVVYGVLLKPLPFEAPDRLVGLWHRAPGMGLDLLNQSPSTYFTYRESGRVFEDVGLWTTWQATVTGRREPERVQVLAMTDAILPLLGTQALQGRLFTKADDSPGAPGRVILTYGYWQRKFGGSRDVIGRTLQVDGVSREVIGVLPTTFKFLRESPSLLMPLQLDRSKTFIGSFNYSGIGRLKPGITIAEADADIARMIPLILDRFPLPPGFSRQMFNDVRLAPYTRPLSQDVIGDIGSMLWILLGTVGVVLLIACANVANLFLVRTEGRQQELAVRVALGASRGRIAARLLGESLVLGAAGSALGLVLAQAGIALLVKLAPTGLPRLDEIAIDPIVLGFTASISLVAALLFGALPVLKFGAPGIMALREGGRSSSEGPDRHRARNVLVITEVALALVLLIVSGLMVRTFVALRQVQPGFVKPEEVQTFRISVPDALIADADAERVARLHQQIGERLSRACLGSRRSGCRPRSRWTVGTPTIPFLSKIGRKPAVRCRRSDASNGLARATSKRWATTSSPAEPSHGATSTRLPGRPHLREPCARVLSTTPRAAMASDSSEPRESMARDRGVSPMSRRRPASPAPAIVDWPLLVKDFWDSPVFVSDRWRYAVRSPRIESPDVPSRATTGRVVGQPQSPARRISGRSSRPAPT